MGIIPNLFGNKKEDAFEKIENTTEVHKEVKLPFNITFSKNTIPGQAKNDRMFTLTNLGRQQLDSMDGSEGEYIYLATMATRKAWSIDDLSKETRYADAKVLTDLKYLVKKGFVKTLGADGA